MKNKLIILSFLVSVLIVASHCTPKTAPSSTGTNISDLSKFEEDILTKINQHRRSMGLSPLKSNNLITTEAEKHSKEMATGKSSFGHAGFDDRVNRISNQLGPARRSAENVALGSHSAEEVVTGWLNSPGHRKNIEGDFTLTGIGVAQNSKGVLYYTQLFIKL